MPSLSRQLRISAVTGDSSGNPWTPLPFTRQRIVLSEESNSSRNTDLNVLPFSIGTANSYLEKISSLNHETLRWGGNRNGPLLRKVQIAAPKVPIRGGLKVDWSQQIKLTHWSASKFSRICTRLRKTRCQFVPMNQCCVNRLLCASSSAKA